MNWYNKLEKLFYIGSGATALLSAIGTAFIVSNPVIGGITLAVGAVVGARTYQIFSKSVDAKERANLFEIEYQQAREDYREFSSVITAHQLGKKLESQPELDTETNEWQKRMEQANPEQPMKIH